MRLEDVTADARILGLAGDGGRGDLDRRQRLRLTYRTDAGSLDERLLYRDRQPRLELAKRGAAFDLTADVS
jgi:hypothetical protein